MGRLMPQAVKAIALATLRDETMGVLEERDYNAVRSCIAGTRMALAVCRHHGIKARPLVARAYIVNPTARERMDAGVPPLEAVNVPPGWSVGVGWPSPGRLLGETDGRSWAGHLVAVVEDRYLLDVTIGAASRPQHNMTVPSGLLLSLDDATRGWRLDGGSGIMYRTYATERSYTDAPDWRFPAAQQPVVGELIRRIAQHAREMATSRG